MSKLPAYKNKILPVRYQNLLSLIEARRAEEALHPDKFEYQQYPTTYDFRDREGDTLLHLAAFMGDLDKLKQCREVYDIDPRIQNNMQLTAAHCAFIRGNKDSAEYLIDSSISKITEQLKLEYPDLAAEDKDRFIQLSKIALLPESRYWVDSSCLEYYDALVKAALPEQLINKSEGQLVQNMCIRLQDNFWDLAAEQGNCSLIEGYRNQSGLTAQAFQLQYNPLLKTAMLNNQDKLVEQLVNWGFSGLSLDSKGGSALHLAAEFNSLKYLQQFLQLNIDPNITNNYGETALYVAIREGRQELAQFLLDHGADPTIKTFEGNTLYHAAASKNSSILNNLQFGTYTAAFSKMQDQPNIFGHSAQQTDVLPQILQHLILLNCDYYQRLLYRKPIASGGQCEGLLFLFQYYDSLDELTAFNQKFAAISTWDGTAEGLNQSVITPSCTYSSLEQMIEECLSNVVQFQVDIELTRVSARSKDLQNRNSPKANYLYKSYKQGKTEQIYALTGNPEDIIRIIPNKSWLKCSYDQIVELLTLFNRLPPFARIVFSGANHVVGMVTQPDRLFKYYDSNLDYLVTKHFDPQSMALMINRSLFRNIDPAKINEELYDIQFAAYRFAWQAVSSAHYRYFKNRELPKSKQEAMAYASVSKMGFNHLHVAILMNSLSDVKRLVSDGFVDINQPLNYHDSKMTPLGLALKLKRYDIVDYLIEQRAINISKDEAFKHLKNNKKQINPLLTLLAHPKFEDEARDEFLSDLSYSVDIDYSDLKRRITDKKPAKLKQILSIIDGIQVLGEKANRLYAMGLKNESNELYDSVTILYMMCEKAFDAKEIDKTTVQKCLELSQVELKRCSTAMAVHSNRNHIFAEILIVLSSLIVLYPLVAGIHYLRTGRWGLFSQTNTEKQAEQIQHQLQLIAT